jgi:CHAD domain-containing protein
MPYRFKINEPVEKGFRRIAREQLDVALAELAAPHIPPTGVHECRKALKRLRALVRLLAPALGRSEARRRAKALSAVARMLSARRDQAVMLETVARLAMETGTDGAFTLAPLRAHLVGKVGEEAQPLNVDCAAKARMLLLREAKKFARTKFRSRGFAALEGGLEKSYGQARKAMKNAYSEPSDESFHTLRKAVQWHWRQMSLLARAWPDEFAVRVAAARELSQMLGDDHDLAMLVAAAATADDISYEHKDAIIAICQRRQQALRDATEFRAARLFAETAKAFTKRMEAYWKYARVLDPRLEASPITHPEAQKTQLAIEADGHRDVRGTKPVQAKPRLTVKAPVPASSQRRA